MSLPTLNPQAEEPFLCRIDPLVDGILETQLMLMIGRQCVARVGMRHIGVQAAAIRQLFVAVEHRKTGFGSRLVKECIALASRSGCYSIDLGVSPGNLEVIPFYEKLGFVDCGQHWSGDTVMTLSLKPLTLLEEGQ